MLRFALIAAASAVASYFPVRFLLSPSAFRADVATADVATYLHDDSLRHAARVKVQEAWVDSVYHTLSEEERVGQLFMIRAHSDKGAEYEAAVATQIERYKVGGVCFFQGTPTRQAELTNRYQAASRVPLLVAIDGEWGLSMRLKGVPAFPHQQLIGAVQDNALVYEFGQMVAAHCRRIGVNVNFAPDIDINNNAANPVIGDRSFGEDKYNVAQKGLLYARGMQEGQVMACGKHFPGHGDTDVDSHLDLPLIPFSVNRLDSLELYPFRELAKGGLMSMMIAHLSIPALDPTPHLPSTLSRPIVTGVLRQKLGFEGLIFTDALEMQGVVKYFPNGTASAKALAAGADVASMPVVSTCGVCVSPN